ncbi:MlaE family lipid ABC transporter permease subunit [Aquibaculum arenosum]|uniref:MlaE family lipid ABC transporter permease subunit n=1 Tax=Aquibaculum arenosum TaxID=3032591 RepID=A0ABT5YHZ7_9PROT|nr:MlaE family lipid ABC transporter permease subunit [Fodinicurvata sp. CAU 1616]MDF2094562.1 MlaE family lipid ABC transporter permease subunit [Fodinicurvata sp. CAU 1616]
MATAGREAAARLTTDRDGSQLRLLFAGSWTTANLADREAELDGTLNRRALAGVERAVLSLDQVTHFDTAGAWATLRTARRLRDAGVEVAIEGAGADRQRLLEAVEQTEPAPSPPRGLRFPLSFLANLGKLTLTLGADARALTGFLGLTTLVFLRALLRPSRIRFTSLIHHMQKTGVDSLPIVGLLAFLIGVVLAYQGADQLARFGAQIYTVNLLGISVLREMGILITAIIVAGRSGSAFTAQIGTMKVNQEIDAMRTIGLDPVEVLVLPRALALVLVMPLLTFYANIMAILGGGLMVWVLLGIDPAAFVRQLHQSLNVEALLVGMIKAPVFAFVIGLVGCFEGLRTGGNAESVGTQTTRAVVEAIFLVIVLDAFFSVFFSVIGV